MLWTIGSGTGPGSFSHMGTNMKYARSSNEYFFQLLLQIFVVVVVFFLAFLEVGF
jgi:hypothetical protein